MLSLTYPVTVREQTTASEYNKINSVVPGELSPEKAILLTKVPEKPAAGSDDGTYCHVTSPVTIIDFRR